MEITLLKHVFATLFVLCFSASAFSMPMLPIFNIVGATTPEGKVTATIKVRATSLDLAYCSQEVTYRNETFKHPHVYQTKGLTIAGYYGHFILDIDLNKRILGEIKKDILNGFLTLEEGLSVEKYFADCNFETTLVTVGSDDSFLVIRNTLKEEEYSNTFYVQEGRTVTSDYPLSVARGHINLKIFF